MGSSFVSRAGQGFWVNDSLLRLWLRLAALHISDGGIAEDGIGGLRDRWLLHSRESFVGCIDAGLDKFSADQSARDSIAAACEQLRDALERGEAPLDAGTLNVLGIVGLQFLGDVPRKDLRDLCESFLLLLADRFPATASDQVYIPARSSGVKE